MQIEVDNPMAILTQDTARMFLANSTGKDKYTFFLKGTQLERLADDYRRLDEDLASMHHRLSQKRDALPEIAEEVKQLEARWTVPLWNEPLTLTLGFGGGAAA